MRKERSMDAWFFGGSAAQRTHFDCRCLRCGGGALKSGGETSRIDKNRGASDKDRPV
jgi:hypothetical protein